MHRHYAGIGSRDSPAEILELMEGLGRALALAGWKLRTGGAPGADQAFEAGCRASGEEPELWLPWEGFEGRRGRFPSPEAFLMAAQLHPNWPALRRGGRALHARNCHQILGARLNNPVQRVICWTPDGSLDGEGGKSGGTGQALRLATRHGIPVRNLARDEHRAVMEQWLSEQPLS